MKKHLSFILVIIAVLTYGQEKSENPTITMKEFDDFIKKEKFIAEENPFYPGISDPAMLPILTKKINEVANDFKETANNHNHADEEFLIVIKNGLAKFTEIYLDTEDRERVCGYFEELMDIVDLESSNGQLMNFMYGFDPSELN